MHNRTGYATGNGTDSALCYCTDQCALSCAMHSRNKRTNRSATSSHSYNCCCRNDAYSNCNLCPVRQRPITVFIESIYRIICAVGKKVKAVQSLIGTQICRIIAINEPSHNRVVISTPEIIQSCFGIIDISPVAEGVEGAKGGGHTAASCQDVTPSIVSIGRYSGSTGVQDCRHVALEVGDIEVVDISGLIGLLRYQILLIVSILYTTTFL